MSTDETKAARIARLRTEKSEREKELAAKQEDATLEGLELEAKFSKDGGRLGRDFAIVDATSTGDGYVVVKLGADLAFRKFIDANHTAEGAVDIADVADFVGPSVIHPTQEQFAALTERRGYILNRAAEALSSLHGVRQKKTEGKF